MLSSLIPIFFIFSFVNAQGYGDAPEPPRTVTTAPILIDCGTPPAPKLPSFADLFTTTPPYQGPIKIPTWNDLFPTTNAPPKIEYVSSYQTAPPAIPKIPTIAELFPPAPIAHQKSYEIGPPSAQPRDPYPPTTVTNDEEDDGDESFLRPDESEEVVEQPEISPKEEKTRAKLEKLRRMHGVKSIKLGSVHHLDLHNHHHLRNHP